jgi:hypothetical protein
LLHPLPFRKEIARCICFFPLLFQVHGYCRVTCARHLFDAAGAPRIVMTRQEIVLGNQQGSGLSATGYVRCDAVVMDPQGLPGSGQGGADCNLEAVTVCCTRHGSGDSGFQPTGTALNPDPTPPIPSTSTPPLSSTGCVTPRQFVPIDSTCACPRFTTATAFSPYSPYNPTQCPGQQDNFPTHSCVPV